METEPGRLEGVRDEAAEDVDAREAAVEWGETAPEPVRPGSAFARAADSVWPTRSGRRATG